MSIHSAPTRVAKLISRTAGSLLSAGVTLTFAFTTAQAATQYTYDDLNRLTKVQYDDGRSITYTYDAAGNLLSTQAKGSGPAGASKLVDTGVGADRCVKATASGYVSCADPEAIALSGPGKQDGMEVHARSYSEVPRAGGGFYARTECVKDDVTGLMWEGKTAGGGARDARRVTWDSASGYVNTVNGMALCGYTDWRMPLPEELQSLSDHSKNRSGMMLDAQWFPNTPSTGAGHSANGFWAGPSRAGYGDYAWMVHISVAELGTYTKGTPWYLRLVRGALPPAANRYTYSAAGDEVTDTFTGLVWQRCLVGSTWNGTACTGAYGMFTPSQALAAARDVAGWRLPNIIELTTLVDRTQPGVGAGTSAPGTINPVAFPGMPQQSTWSSTPGYLDGSFSQWGLMDVHFTDGYSRYFNRPIATIRLLKQSAPQVP